MCLTKAFDGIDFKIYNKMRRKAKISKDKDLAICTKCDKQSIRISGLSVDEAYKFSSCPKCKSRDYLEWPKGILTGDNRSRGEMITDLKELFKLLDYIPREQFIRDPGNMFGYHSFFITIGKEKTIEIVKILTKMNKNYKKEFGSWLKALIAADLVDGDVRITPRGIMCIASDGHDCRSLSEKIIDDWLFKRKIKHEKEYPYPIDENLNPNGKMRCDWKVDNYYVEFFGLKGTKEYDIKTELKKELCEKNKLKLIDIFSNDIKNLNKKLRVLEK